MPLAYQETQPLAVPDEAFNNDDIATIVVTGGSYGGMWVLNAISLHQSPDKAKLIGSIQTDERGARRPDLAVDTAYVWVNDYCVRNGVKLAYFENMNSHYGPDEAPFFAGAMFLIDHRK